MWKARFGKVDVTDKLRGLTNRKNFVVSIRFLGDPQPGVYKFLEIYDDLRCVWVGEDDRIANLDTVLDNPPSCRKLGSLDSFIQLKEGFQIASPEANKYMCQLIEKKALVLKATAPDSIFQTKNDTFEFGHCADVLAGVVNPLELLCQAQRITRPGGHVIVTSHVLMDTKVVNLEKEFRQLLQIYDDRKWGNNPQMNPIFDLSMLFACLRFALLKPLYAQVHQNSYVIITQKIAVDYTLPRPLPYEEKKNQDENTVVFHEHRKQPSSTEDIVFPDMIRCPHCGEAFWKDERCSFVYCGLAEDGKFRVGYGCGRSFCFDCGKKYCGLHYDPKNGQQIPESYKSVHDNACCRQEHGFQEADYCPGGHSSHCSKRWM